MSWTAFARHPAPPARAWCAKPSRTSSKTRAITQDTRADHAQYLAHGLKLLKDDSRAIFTGAARASEAVAYLNGWSPPGRICPSP